MTTRRESSSVIPGSNNGENQMDRAYGIAQAAFIIMQSQTFVDWYDEFTLWVEGNDKAKTEVELKMELAKQFRKFV